MPESELASVRVWRDRRAGRICLNRPKALNALDLGMIQRIHEALLFFADDPTIHLVVIDAVEGKAFCSGADIRAMRTAGLAGDLIKIESFFGAEYRLNLAIAEFKKPWVSLIDGICMGGGIGISVHGSHRIVSESAVLAMPETAIALFPDVGATYFLPRLPGKIGLYLGLTGARLAGADSVHAGLATHFVSSASFPFLIEALAADGIAVLADFFLALPEFGLTPYRAEIDAAFNAKSPVGILEKLSETGSDFAKATGTSFLVNSASSITWSFEALKRGAFLTLSDCLEMELSLVKKVALLPEFHEGVRSLLVDKDRSPQWDPASLREVDLSMVETLFK